MLCLGEQAFSQSGFLGKKVNFYLSGGMSPSWMIANQNQEMGFFKFDPWIAPGVDFVLSDRHAIGLEFQYYNSIYPSNFGDMYGYSEKPLAYDDIFVKSLGVFWKLYANDYAPLGSWAKIQFNYIKYEAGVENLVDTSMKSNFNSTLLGVQVGFGHTYILSNCITVSPCATLGLAIGKGDFVSFPSELYSSDPITLADRKVRSMCLINLSVAIGLMLF
jgi:hypothetical protein